MKKAFIFALLVLSFGMIAGCTPQVDPDVNCDLTPDHPDCVDTTDKTAPVITVDNSKPLTFVEGSSEPDWLTYVSVNDNVDGAITLTAANVNKTAVNMNVAGTFNVVFTVTDAAGNTATRTITITISPLGTDVTPPVISLVANKPLTFMQGDAEPNWLDYVTVTDDVDGAIVLSTTNVNKTAVNMNTAGTFDVIFTATDAAGNTATRTITITIEPDTTDTTPPVITLNTTKPMVFTEGDPEPNWLEYITAADDVDGEITITLSHVNKAQVNMNAVGTFNVVFTVSDASGNEAIRTINITITQKVIAFGDCDPNYLSDDPILSFDNTAVRFGTWMRNFLDPFFRFAKQTELNTQKKTCTTRAVSEHDVLPDPASNSLITWVPYFNDINHWQEIINNHLAGDHKADLYNINSHYLGRLARAGSIRPITEYVEKYFPNYYWDANIQIGTWDGEIYGFWNERNNVNMGIYVNLDLINEYSQANPAELWQDGQWDWARMMTMAEEVKANAPANFKIFGISEYYAGSYFIGSNGGRVMNPFTNEFELDDPKTVRALEFIRTLKEKDYIWYAPEGDPTTRAEFVGGNMLFYFGADWISGDSSILKPGGAVQFTLGMVPFPVGPDVTDIASQYRLPISVSNLWVVRGDATDVEADRLVQFFKNITPWGDDVEQDYRYYQTMEDHMDDLTSLEAYISVSRYGYYDKTFLFGIVWGDELAPGIGNIFGQIANGASITSTIDAALPSLEARVREALGIS